MNGVAVCFRGGAHMLVALLLALCLVPGGLAASRFHERNHTGLLWGYGFTEGQVSSSPPSQVVDFSGRNLLGNLTMSTSNNIVWDPQRQGFSIPSDAGGVRATSQPSSAAILPHLSENVDFTLEFFISSPNNPRSENLFIAGVGDWAPGDPPSSCWVGDGPQFNNEGDWRLTSQLGSVLEFEVNALQGGAPTCLIAVVGISTNRLRHVVVRGTSAPAAGYPGVLSFVSHSGSSAILDPTGIEFSTALWAKSRPLVIANPHAARSWKGKIYMIAMYNRFLSLAEIAANREFGPPNSFPYGAGAVEVDEDAPATLVSAA